MTEYARRASSRAIRGSLVIGLVVTISFLVAGPSGQVLEGPSKADAPRAPSLGTSSTPAGTNYTVTSVNVTGRPLHEAYDPVNGYVYVATVAYVYSAAVKANLPSPNVTVLNGTTVVGSIAQLPGTPYSPADVVCDNRTGLVYLVLDWGDPWNNIPGLVIVLNGTNVVGSIPVGSGPVSGIYDPWSDSVYVTNAASSNVSVIQGRGLIATIAVGALPWGGAFDGRNGEIYVADYNGGDLSIINGTKFGASVIVGSHPMTVLYDRTNGYIYAGLRAASSSEYDQEAEVNGTRVIGSVHVGNMSFDERPVLDPTSGSVYVLNGLSSNVSVLQDANLSATIAVGTEPYSGAYDAATGEVFVAHNRTSGSVSVIRGTSVVATIGAGVLPSTTVYDSGNACVYVGNFGSDNVSIICGGGTLPRFPVRFSESGLPKGTTWGVRLGSTRLLSNASSILFSVPNGSYPFSVAPVPGFGATPPTGSVSVQGVGRSVAIGFSRSGERTPYPVIFSESGLVSGSPWGVTLNGTTSNSTGSTVSFSEANGSYLFQVGCGSGCTASPSSGYANVTGRAVLVNVTCTTPPALLPLTFRESGLGAGATWTVVLTTDSAHANIQILVSSSRAALAGSDIGFLVSAGGYAYTSTSVGHPAVSGAVRVGAGAPGVTVIHFAPGPRSPNANNTIFGLPTWAGVIGVVVGAIGAIGLGVSVYSIRTARLRRIRSVVARMEEMDWETGEDGFPEPRIGR